MPNLAVKEICTGCTACANICPNQCIEMTKDENGFAYPQITNPSACIECGQCEKICPVLNNEAFNKELPIAYAAFSKDENMRMDSSSGGIFTELASYIIEQGGVVYGAAYDEKFNVRHFCAESVAELSKLRGAKYAESDLGNSFAEIISRLHNGQKVLFSGTPCQVAGLKALAGDAENLFCADFVCHGVPSPMAWQSYVKHRADADSNGEYPSAINLRSKSTGWSRYQYSNLFEYKNGVSHSATSGQSLFMKLFVGDYICRESCENCKFKGYNRVSDITLGDFWGIWDIDPQMDDNKGTSVILIQSEKGRTLWESINENIVCKEVALEDASVQNPSMLVASKANANRDKALRLISEGKIDECNQLFIQRKPSVINQIKRKIKRILHV